MTPIRELSENSTLRVFIPRSAVVGMRNAFGLFACAEGPEQQLQALSARALGLSLMDYGTEAVARTADEALEQTLETRVTIPTLETDRLTLDAPRESDFAGYASIVTTDRGRFIGGPFDGEEAWLDFSQMVAGWVFRGFGALSIRAKGGGGYLGTVLIHHEYGDPEPELGWLLTAEAEGHGFAFEAATVMREWAYAYTELRTLVSYIDPENRRAVALAERLGGRRVDGPADCVTYRYGRPAR